MKIAVFGLWHLGTVTAACLAKKGFNTTGLDPDASVIEGLNNGRPPLFEPGLNERIAAGLKNGCLHFTMTPEEALPDADYLWVTFDTPVDQDDRADVDYVKNQILAALKHLKRGAGVVISSQAPVGFTKSLEDYATRYLPEKALRFACSPENLRLGKAISVFEEPDRIVIGVRCEGDRERFLPLFQQISGNLEWMKTESAEMTKHAINAFLATSVAFANEIASICEEVGADAADVTRGLKTESRIGPKAYLNPGAAFAGGTLARDVSFLIGLGEKWNKSSRLLRAIPESNDDHKNWAKNQCLKHMGSIAGKKFALLGLTYKPNTDTLRRSLAVELGEWIIKNGGTILAYDPKVNQLPDSLSKKFQLCSNAESAIEKADCVVVTTEWPEFKELSDITWTLLGSKIVIDPNGFLKKCLEPRHPKKYTIVGKNYEA